MAFHVSYCPDTETVKTSKTRKKNRRRKEKQKNSSVIDCDKNCKVNMVVLCFFEAIDIFDIYLRNVQLFVIFAEPGQ